MNVNVDKKLPTFMFVQIRNQLFFSVRIRIQNWSVTLKLTNEEFAVIAQTFGFLLPFLFNFYFWNFNKITIINNFDAFLLLLLLLLLLNFSLLDPDPHSDWGSWSGRDPQPCRKMWLTLCGRWTRGSWPGCGTHSPQCTWCRRSRQETSPSDQTQMFLNNRNIEIQCLILVRSR